MKTYDCTSGGASYCYGCYTMGEDKEGYGDWLRKEEVVERLRSLQKSGETLDSLIEELSG